MKRVDGVKKSPVFANFDETMNGITSVRGYQVQDRFINKNTMIQDESQRIWNNLSASQRWIGVWLESLGAFIVFFAALFSVIGRDNLSGGDVGVSVSYALQVNRQLTLY